MSEIGFLLFDGITALDAVGPYEVLQRLPGARVRMLAKAPGPVRTHEGNLGLVADAAIADVPKPDVIVVPGGFGVEAVMRDEPTLAWLRAAHETSRWTTSVCTGSLILGAAGLLRGLRATTHWMWMDRLRELGADPTGERVVRQGKVVTAAGVSSGIDMALRLVADEAGEAVARGVQLSIEYDPQPPFDAGSPQKAGPEIVEAVRRVAERLRSQVA